MSPDKLRLARMAWQIWRMDVELDDWPFVGSPPYGMREGYCGA